MIVSDPDKDPSRVLIVNFTSWKPYHDLTLVLEGGEHRFIRHRTCVNYPQARVLSLAELHRLEENRPALPR